MTNKNDIDTAFLRKIFANPFYAIQFSEGLFGEHQLMVSEEIWIKTALHEIEDMGAEKWLKLLLEVLKGDFVEGPDLDNPCA